MAPLATLGDQDFHRFAVKIDPWRFGEGFLDDVEIQSMPGIPLDEEAALFGEAAAGVGVDEGAEPGDAARTESTRRRDRGVVCLFCAKESPPALHHETPVR